MKKKPRAKTRNKALDILSNIDKNPMTWQEICDKHNISRTSWSDTYLPAVRMVAEEVGMYVPRPTPEKGYRYVGTDVWNDSGDEPDISQGVKFRVADEYTRASTSLDHIKAAERGAIKDGDIVLASALADLNALTSGALVTIKGIAERVGAKVGDE